MSRKYKTPEDALVDRINQLARDIALYESHVDKCEIENVARAASIISLNIYNVRENKISTDTHKKQIDQLSNMFMDSTTKLRGCECKKKNLFGFTRTYAEELAELERQEAEESK